MTRNGIIVLTLFAALACKRDQTKPPEKAPATFSDNGAAASGRIGKYLQDAVVTDNLRNCWGGLKGEGAVAIDMNYHKAGDNWTFDSARVTKSTLDEAQNAVALKCIQEAARETSFAANPKEALEVAAPNFVVRMGWSVPLPAKGTETSSIQMARMIGGGGNGVITVPGCSDCVSNPNPPYGLKCSAKSSGSNVDCEEISSNVCATTPRACLRGGFGGTKGVIMF
jgi:hypothetical protein